MPKSPDPVVQRARGNRAEMTSAEDRLWSLLRNRRLGHKFRRQHPIGRYVIDFACPAIHLVIEVDGASHEAPDQRAFDAARTDYLHMNGWRVMRIPNVDVLQSLGHVEAAILARLEA